MENRENETEQLKVSPKTKEEYEKEKVAICSKCGRVFTNDDNYIKIVGSIYLGEDKGLIGGNKETTTYFCPHCLINFLQAYKELDENCLKTEIHNLQKYLNDSLGVDIKNRGIDGPSIPEFLGDK